MLFAVLYNNLTFFSRCVRMCVCAYVCMKPDGVFFRDNCVLQLQAALHCPQCNFESAASS